MIDRNFYVCVCVLVVSESKEGENKRERELQSRWVCEMRNIIKKLLGALYVHVDVFIYVCMHVCMFVLV